MNIEEQRKAFESWAYSNKWNIFRVRDMGLDHYVDDFVNGAWHGWLAAQNQEGYVLVPFDEINRIAKETDDFYAYEALRAMIEESRK